MLVTEVLGDAAVGIVVPTYRRPRLLAEALAALLTQDVTHPFGVVVVNDGCDLGETDGVCQSARLAFGGRLLYLRTTHRGAPAARNAGIDLALKAWPSLEALYFLDDDDRPMVGTLDRLYQGLRENNADWAFSDMYRFGEKPQLCGTAGDYSVLEQFVTNYVSMCSMVSRRVFDAGFRLDEAMTFGLEDWEFWLRIARAGFRGRYVPHAAFHYRQNCESVTATANRRGAEAFGYLYNTHRAWMNPANAVELEELEAPRYAFLLEDDPDVVLCTDPHHRNSRIGREAFLSRVRSQIASGRVRCLPGYLVSGSVADFEWLDAARVLNGILWHMELTSASGATVLLVLQDKGLRIMDAQTADDGVAVLAMMPLGSDLPRTESAAADVGLMPLLEVGMERPLRRRHPLSRLHAVSAALADETNIACVGTHLLRAQDNRRRRDHLTSSINRVFGTAALFPATSGRGARVGITVAGRWDAETVRTLTSLTNSAKSCGASCHLFWLVPECSAPMLPTTDNPFDTVTYLRADGVRPQELMASRRQLLGLLGSMHVLVNHECDRLLPLHASLRQWGTPLIYSMSSRAAPSNSHEFLAAVRHEASIDTYLTCDSSTEVRLRAHGVPASKVSSDPADAFQLRGMHVMRPDEATTSWIGPRPQLTAFRTDFLLTSEGDVFDAIQ